MNWKQTRQQQILFWFRRPQFLWEEENKWPEQPTDLSEVEETDAEVKKFKVNARVGATVISDSDLPASLNCLIS